MLGYLKVNYCNFCEFKTILDDCRKNKIIYRKHFDFNDYVGNINSYLDIERTRVILTTRYKGKVQQFHFRLDSEDPSQYTNGGEAYRILKQYVKDLPDLREDPFYKPYLEDGDIASICSIAAVADYNKKFDGTRTPNCWGYDINSSWPYFMKFPMPDTSVHPRIFDKVKPGEIGFDRDNNSYWRLKKPGQSAEFVFPEIESPFKRFVDTWYEKKKKAAKGSKERIKAKGVLNYAIGYLQRVNPFIRATVICRANEHIASLITAPDGSIRDDVIYWNTDSIVCTHELPELPTGPELGEWKLEHRGSFALKKSTYQWDYSLPTHKGVAKGWYKKKYPNGVDILKDDIPTIDDNYYYITPNNEIKRF